MPATLAISDLSWSTPDGRVLFSHLDLTFTAERAGLIGRNGVGKSTLLRLIAGDLPVPAGRITVNGTLGVLRQAVTVRPGETVGHLFDVADALAILRRAESGDASVEDIAAADWTLEARLAAALAQVELDVAPHTLLAALSGGQVTRAALAALVFRQPDMLLLDEPTNNLDRDGRRAVHNLLANWRGGAIVVSHDRELLETMDVIVELTSLGATRYGGSWSDYRARKDLELAATQHDLDDAEKRVAEVARSAQATAERQARRDSVGKKMAAKGGTPRILLGAMKNRSEQTGGANTRLAERQRIETSTTAVAARARIEVLQPFSVSLPPTGLPAGRTVLALDHVSAGYDDGTPVIRDLSLTVTGPERIAITGRNGSGKTTLLRLITGRLRPQTGKVEIVPDHVFLDQQVDLLDPAQSIRDNYIRLNPGADETACRAALARFMFRADAALQIVGSLSGGQTLRAGLACTLSGKPPPSLVILDEPTNHLDIDAIAEVEAGLRAYDGALVVVSHDAAFLKAIRIERTVALA